MAKGICVYVLITDFESILLHAEWIGKKETENTDSQTGYEMWLTVAGLAGGNLSQIPIVVSLHFQVEDLALSIAGFWNQVFV